MPFHVLGHDPFSFLTVDGGRTGLHASGRFHYVATGVKVGVVSRYGVLAHYVGVGLVGRKHKRPGAVGRAWDLLLAVLRIEHLKLLHREFQYVGYLLEVYATVHVDGVRYNRLLCQCGRNVVLVVVVHHVGGCNETGHVAARLPWEVGVDGPEVLSGVVAGTAQGLVHVARAAVVGGYSQRPVFIYVVELAQIARSSLRRAHRVAALVNKRVDFQSKPAGCREHNLPEAHGSRARYGVGVHRRLDYGQIFQLDGDSLLLDGLLEYRHIVEAHAEHALHQRALASGIHVDVLAHHRVEWHFDGGGDGLQALDQFGVGGGHVRTVVNLLVESSVVLQIPVLHHAVHVGLHAFGKHHRRVGGSVGQREYRGPCLRAESGGAEGG